MTKKSKRPVTTKNDPHRTETVGALVEEQNQKYMPEEVSATEIIQEAHSDYENELLTCIENGRKLYPSDFYVVILQKVERLMTDVSRLFFMPRLSCPTPTYDQTVYKYHRDGDMLEFLWVVPDKFVCQYYRENALTIPEDEKDLRNFVLEFYDGTLDARCRAFNGETGTEPRLVLCQQEN